MRFGGNAVYVDDVKASLDFYRRAFGFETKFYDEEFDYGELEVGGPILGFASHALGAQLMPGHHDAAPGSGPGSSRVEIAFFTDDVPAAFARAVEAGAKPVAQPKKMPWGLTISYVETPDGTLVGLTEPPPADIPAASD